MYYNIEAATLPEALGLTAERAEALNEIIRAAYTALPEVYETTTLLKQFTFLTSVEEAFYCAWHLHNLAAAPITETNQL